MSLSRGLVGHVTGRQRGDAKMLFMGVLLVMVITIIWW